MARSYVSPRMIARLERRVAPRIFETQKAVNNGGVTIMFARHDATTGDYIALPPQTVVLKYGNRQEQSSQSESLNTTLIDGEMVFLYPTDVQPDDIFTLEGPDGYVSGRILNVFPPKLGRQKATWTMRLGGI
jgi:hypothetical protein